MHAEHNIALSILSCPFIRLSVQCWYCVMPSHFFDGLVRASFLFFLSLTNVTKFQGEPLSEGVKCMGVGKITPENGTR